LSVVRRGGLLECRSKQRRIIEEEHDMTRKSKIVRLGKVSRQTKAMHIIGVPEIGNPILSYLAG
jgi:hypothetical protein